MTILSLPTRALSYSIFDERRLKGRDIMEEGERNMVNKEQTSPGQTPPTSSVIANGKTAGSTAQDVPKTEPTSSEELASIAAMMFSSKIKSKGASNTDRKRTKHNGCDDDLPLGSEAHSLSLDHAALDLEGYPVPEDKRSKWPRTGSQGMLGWQSFNSDVSNQTSSSASLEQLLNDRQVDPEVMLMNLGFGGEPQLMVSTINRVPERFLSHPSRIYGINPPGVSEEQEEDAGDNVDAAAPVPGRNNTAASGAAVASPLKKRTGIWTLARTLSMLRMKTPSRGHTSPSSGGQPLPNHPVSILNSANQKYLASKGFYEKQGWPKGTFAEPEEESLQPVNEDVECKDAASRRKMFQKTKSRRKWSLCGSGENEASVEDQKWVTQSVDDSKSREDLTGQDDSLGQGHYFSTTTESSTDSLDTPNLETERAFEKIRQEYNESRKREHSSSDDLFLPCREGRSSQDAVDHEENLVLDQGLDLLNTASINYFVSPASSRQTTVEKAPSINDGDIEGKRREDSQTDTSSGKGLVYYTGEDVRIIISNSDGRNGKCLSPGNQSVMSSRLTAEGTQTTSSDSSSSGATAVGGSIITITAEEAGHRRLSESEISVTDRDSISRTNSPYHFHHKSDLAKLMISNSCQTTDSDFTIAAGRQRVSVATFNTSNKSLLHVQVNQSGASREGKDKEYTLNEQNPRVQLSTLPPVLNHVELMKRLQHSQNELSRMGSVQSDSSGFGDADPTVPETDSLKLKTSRDVLTELDSNHLKHSPAPSKPDNKYVTMCYIPTLTSKLDPAGGLRHRGNKPADGTNQIVSYPSGTFVAPWRSRSESDPRHSGLATRSDLGYTKPWFGFDENENISHEKPSPSNRYNSIRILPERSRKEASIQAYSRPYSDIHRNIDHRRMSGSSATDRYHQRHSKRDLDSSQRTFTSQIDLYANAGGFSRKATSSYGDNHPGSFRRHSDEGILEGRNVTPLSQELALARDSEVTTNPPSLPGDTSTTYPRSDITQRRSPTPDNRTTPVASSHNTSDTSLHYPFLAGNISGLSTSTVSDKPISPRHVIPRFTPRQRSCDILDDGFDDRIAAHSNSRMSDDMDSYSQVAENSSDFSVQSTPEGLTRSGVLESRKLARLINQPISFRGTKRRGSHYRPSHQFKDWNMISKRKRLHEENRLLQCAVQKYKTELTIMEASFLVDFHTLYPDMDEQERDEVGELEWLWSEVKGQVMEMEHLLAARIREVQVGLDIYSLTSSLGVIGRMVELVKEQFCQQQLSSIRTEDGRDLILDDDVDILSDELSYHSVRHGVRHGSLQLSQSWLAGVGHMSTPRPISRFHSSSTSNLPLDLNISLEQIPKPRIRSHDPMCLPQGLNSELTMPPTKIKSSVMSKVKQEINESTKKLEQDLQEKDREIKRLQEQLSQSLSEPQVRRWTPKSSVRSQKSASKSSTRRASDGVGHETDV